MLIEKSKAFFTRLVHDPTQTLITADVNNLSRDLAFSIGENYFALTT